jgi:hypothetical protein
MEPSSDKTNRWVVLSYFLIPTVMLIVGYILFPYPPSSFARQMSFIPLFLGLILGYHAKFSVFL